MHRLGIHARPSRAAALLDLCTQLPLAIVSRLLESAPQPPTHGPRGGSRASYALRQSHDEANDMVERAGAAAIQRKWACSLNGHSTVRVGWESNCQWTCMTAKRNAVLMPNSSTPFTASRALIIWNRDGNVNPGISNVVMLARE